LEVEVYRKFARWDQKFIQGKKEEYPDLVKPPPGVGHSGAGSVNWVGLNPDPCKAKFQAKQAALKELEDPLKAAFIAKQGLVSAGTRSLPTLSTSMTSKFRDRRLSRYSASLHYLEQKKGMSPMQRDDVKESIASGKSDIVPIEELLYSGISRDNEGRLAYLQNRHQMAPQDKAKNPLTAAQVVGWQCYRGPGKFVGQKAKRCEPPQSMIYIA